MGPGAVQLDVELVAPVAERDAVRLQLAGDLLGELSQVMLITRRPRGGLVEAGVLELGVVLDLLVGHGGDDGVGAGDVHDDQLGVVGVVETAVGDLDVMSGHGRAPSIGRYLWTFIFYI